MISKDLLRHLSDEKLIEHFDNSIKEVSELEKTRKIKKNKSYNKLLYLVSFSCLIIIIASFFFKVSIWYFLYILFFTVIYLAKTYYTNLKEKDHIRIIKEYNDYLYNFIASKENISIEYSETIKRIYNDK